MKTSFEEIVKVDRIGKAEPTRLNDLLSLAQKEDLPPSSEDEKKVLFLAVDFQNDFMDEGPLGVPGATKDVERVARFLYNNMDKITDIAVSLDTHTPMQIFHPCWWENQEGKEPAPYTIITFEDVQAGKWTPRFMEKESIDYVENLEKLGKKQLCIWPYHCIQGTFGNALESQLANMIYYHSTARKSEVKTIVKGLAPATEMYGIFRPEYSPENLVHEELLESMLQYDQIFVAGEAKSHCVLESVAQLVEYFASKNRDSSHIYILEDGTSCIPGFEDGTEKAYQHLAKTYGIQFVKTTDTLL